MSSPISLDEQSGFNHFPVYFAVMDEQSLSTMPEAFKITKLIATSTTETILDCVFGCLQEVYIQRYDTFIIMTDMF